MRAVYARAAGDALGRLRLPPPAALLDYEVADGANGPPRIQLVYLSDREMGADAENLITGYVREKLDSPDAPVELEWVGSSWGPVTFKRNQAVVGGADTLDMLDRLGRVLQRQPSLTVEVVAGEAKGERDGTGEARAKAVEEYLSTTYQVNPERMTEGLSADARRDVTLMLKAGARK